MGIHHFYVGRFTMGLLDLGLFIATMYCYINNHLLFAALFFVIDLMHTVIVTYLLLIGKYKDGQGKLITFPGQQV